MNSGKELDRVSPETNFDAGTEPAGKPEPRMREMWEHLQAGLPLTKEERIRIGCGLEILDRFFNNPHETADDDMDTDLLNRAVADVLFYPCTPTPDTRSAGEASNTEGAGGEVNYLHAPDMKPGKWEDAASAPEPEGIQELRRLSELREESPETGTSSNGTGVIAGDIHDSAAPAGEEWEEESIPLMMRPMCRTCTLNDKCTQGDRIKCEGDGWTPAAPAGEEELYCRECERDVVPEWLLTQAWEPLPNDRTKEYAYCPYCGSKIERHELITRPVAPAGGEGEEGLLSEWLKTDQTLSFKLWLVERYHALTEENERLEGEIEKWIADRDRWFERFDKANQEIEHLWDRFCKYRDGIGDALKDVRQYRDSGEPAKSDRAEIEDLTTENERLREQTRIDQKVVDAAYELEIAIRFGSYVRELQTLQEALTDHDRALHPEQNEP